MVAVVHKTAKADTAAYFMQVFPIPDSHPMFGIERKLVQAHETLPTVANQGYVMSTRFLMTCLAVGTLLGPAVALAGDDSDADREHPKAFVKDSVITTKIKAKLAAEHITSLGRINVDTDSNGIVWLSGSARTQEALDKAISIARETEGVKSVKSELTVKKDD